MNAYKKRSFAALLLIVVANTFTVIMALDNSTQEYLTPAYYATTTLTINVVQFFCHKYCGMMVKILEDNDRGSGTMAEQITKFNVISDVIVKRSIL